MAGKGLSRAGTKMRLAASLSVRSEQVESGFHRFIHGAVALAL